MIISIHCKHQNFNREIEFKKGFNIILADKTINSGEKDSRNGLGKSLLIEIIHFCLGASKSGSRLFNKDVLPNIKDYEFTLNFELNGEIISASRQILNPKIIAVNNQKKFTESEWTEFLGAKIFGLTNTSNPYSPSFRSLISYFIRREDYAFSHPFESFAKQLEWSKQVNNAFLLGLSDSYASEWQVLKDKKKLLADLKKAAKSGLVNGILGSLGELESEKIRLQTEIEKSREQLDSFRVHPQYKEIEQQVNILTKEIHQLSNANISDRRILDLYNETINVEQVQEPSIESIEQIYKEACVIFTNAITKQLYELQDFHNKLIENRKQFLSNEIEALNSKIKQREQEKEIKDRQRAELLEILKTHGALEEWTKLEERHTEKLSQFKDISKRIENLKQFETGNSELLIAQEQLVSKARNDYDARDIQRKQVINLFNANSQALYDAFGSLIIDIDDKTGYRFNIDIKRTGATGIEKMKVFCYDLMLIEYWKKQQNSPDFLIHDSVLFDGVDERQIALALKLSLSQSHNNNFQYICALNTDLIANNDLLDDLNLDSYCVLRLKDDKPENSLLGIRF